MMNSVQTTITAMLLSFKMILSLNDNWETYLNSGVYTVREVEKREVDKMRTCMDPEKGLSVHQLLNFYCQPGETSKNYHLCVLRG